MLRKWLIIFGCIFVVSCASSASWQKPANKTDADTYTDLNECTAMGKKVSPNNGGVLSMIDQNNVISNCMKGKGYR
jgi:hypothetical protein